jgi:hypothetical protein
VLGVCEVIRVYMVLANSRPFLNQSYLHGGHALKGGRGDFCHSILCWNIFVSLLSELLHHSVSTISVFRSLIL